MANDNETALLGGGCFWCLEALYQKIDGVREVRSGYAGGEPHTANYDAVCRGGTGHVEVVRIEFDTTKITYSTVLDFFWQIHNPTQLNRQGHDIGTQYRSVIYYYSEEQRETAQASIAEQQKQLKRKIVTTVESAPTFHQAEPYHEHYYEQHPSAPYCRAIIAPKLKKIKI